MHSAVKRGLTQKLLNTVFNGPNIKQIPVRRIKTNVVNFCKKVFPNKLSQFVKTQQQKQNGGMALGKREVAWLDCPSVQVIRLKKDPHPSTTATATKLEDKLKNTEDNWTNLFDINQPPADLKLTTLNSNGGRLQEEDIQRFNPVWSPWPTRRLINKMAKKMPSLMSVKKIHLFKRPFDHSLKTGGSNLSSRLRSRGVIDLYLSRNNSAGISTIRTSLRKIQNKNNLYVPGKTFPGEMSASLHHISNQKKSLFTKHLKGPVGKYCLGGKRRYTHLGILKNNWKASETPPLGVKFLSKVSTSNLIKMVEDELTSLKITHNLDINSNDTEGSVNTNSLTSGMVKGEVSRSDASVPINLSYTSDDGTAKMVNKMDETIKTINENTPLGSVNKLLTSNSITNSKIEEGGHPKDSLISDKNLNNCNHKCVQINMLPQCDQLLINNSVTSASETDKRNIQNDVQPKNNIEMYEFNSSKGQNITLNSNNTNLTEINGSYFSAKDDLSSDNLDTDKLLIKNSMTVVPKFNGLPDQKQNEVKYSDNFKERIKKLSPSLQSYLNMNSNKIKLVGEKKTSFIRNNSFSGSMNKSSDRIKQLINTNDIMNKSTNDIRFSVDQIMGKLGDKSLKVSLKEKSTPHLQAEGTAFNLKDEAKPLFAGEAKNANPSEKKTKRNLYSIGCIEMSRDSTPGDPFADCLTVGFSEQPTRWKSVNSAKRNNLNGWADGEEVSVKPSFTHFAQDERHSEDVREFEKKLTSSCFSKGNEISVLTTEKKFNRAKCFPTMKNDEVRRNYISFSDRKKLLDTKGVLGVSSSVNENPHCLPLQSKEKKVTPKSLTKNDSEQVKRKRMVTLKRFQSQLDMTSPSAAYLSKKKEFGSNHLDDKINKNENISRGTSIYIKSDSNNLNDDQVKGQNHVFKINISPEQTKLLSSLFNNISKKIKEEVNLKDIQNLSLKQVRSQDEKTDYNPQVQEGIEYLLESSGEITKFEKDNLNKFVKPLVQAEQAKKTFAQPELNLKKQTHLAKVPMVENNGPARLKEIKESLVKDFEREHNRKKQVTNELCKILNQVEKQLSDKNKVEVIKIRKPLNNKDKPFRTDLNKYPFLEKTKKEMENSLYQERGYYHKRCALRLYETGNLPSEKGNRLRNNSKVQEERKVTLKNKIAALKGHKFQDGGKEITNTNTTPTDSKLMGESRYISKETDTLKTNEKFDQSRQVDDQKVFKEKTNEMDQKIDKPITKDLDQILNEKGQMVLKVSKPNEETKNVQAQVGTFSSPDPVKFPQVKYCPLNQVLSQCEKLKGYSEPKETSGVGILPKMTKQGLLTKMAKGNSLDDGHLLVTSPKHKWDTAKVTRGPSVSTFQPAQSEMGNYDSRAKYYKQFINCQPSTAISEPFSFRPRSINVTVRRTVSKPAVYGKTSPGGWQTKVSSESKMTGRKKSTEVIHPGQTTNLKTNTMDVLSKKLSSVGSVKRSHSEVVKPFKMYNSRSVPRVKYVKTNMFKDSLPKMNLLKKDVETQIFTKTPKLTPLTKIALDEQTPPLKSLRESHTSLKKDKSHFHQFPVEKFAPTNVLTTLLNSDVPREKIWTKENSDSIITPDQWAQLRSTRLKKVIPPEHQEKKVESEVKDPKEVPQARNDFTKVIDLIPEETVPKFTVEAQNKIDLRQKISSIANRMKLKPYINHLMSDHPWGMLKSKLTEMIHSNRKGAPAYKGECKMMYRCRNPHSVRRMKSKKASNVGRTAPTRNRAHRAHPAPSLVPNPVPDPPQPPSRMRDAESPANSPPSLPPPRPLPQFSHPAPSLFHPSSPASVKSDSRNPIRLAFGKARSVSDDLRFREIQSNFKMKLKNFHQGPINLRNFSTNKVTKSGNSKSTSF